MRTMQALSSPQQQGFERLDKDQQLRRPNQSKGPSPVVLLMLLSLIPVMFCAALGIRYVTRGPRVVHNAGAPKTTAGVPTTTSKKPVVDDHSPQPSPPTPEPPSSPTPEPPSSPTSEPPSSPTPEPPSSPTSEPPSSPTPEPPSSTISLGLSTPSEDHTPPFTPYKPPPGSETHKGDLPADVQPQHYDVTFVLNGTTLADANLEVSGRVAAKLKATAATSKIILKAALETIKEVKMALLTDDAPTPTSLKITSLSAPTSFLIATLEKPLVAQKSYTLLTEYDFDEAAQGAPITITAELARMQLTKDMAHKAFPCFEKTGLNVPIKLTLQTPADLIAVSNAPPEAHSFLAGTLNEHKFSATMPMPPDMLAWSVFPNTMTKLEAIPKKVALYMKAKKQPLVDAAKSSFEFLSKYFQAAAPAEHISKIDLVFSKPADAQDSLGLIVLDDATAAEALCAKIATQWTHVLMRQPSTETWLAKAGVKYLCRLAETEKSNLPTAFVNDLKECMKPAPAAGTKDLLVFRMMHIIHGDAAFQAAIQKYVTATIFGSTADDKEHAIFASLVPKEHVVAWLKEDFKTKKLVREFGTAKKIRWKNADTTNTPFAKSAESGTITMPAPAAVAVEWLNATKADFVVTAEDTKPLYVNPSMMACYGVELDSKSWELIGKSMETAKPDAINGWYLLGEAAKQFKAVQAPDDFTGFMWMWAVLKNGDKDLWDEHVEQFIDTEKQAHSMLTTTVDETMYKKRLDAVIMARLPAIEAKDITAANKDKTPVLLANLACHLGNDKCTALLPPTVDTTKPIDKTFTTDPLDADAVACFLGSKAATEDDFTKLKQKATPPAGDEASLAVRVAFCGCVAETLASTAVVKDKIKEVFTEVLQEDPADAKAAVTRPSQGLRKAALDILTADATAADAPTPDAYKKVLANAVALKLAFTATEAASVKAKATAFTVAADDASLTSLEKGAIAADLPLLEWIKYSPTLPP